LKKISVFKGLLCVLVLCLPVVAAETGQKLGLKVRVIDAIDRSGRGPDGNPIPDLPKQPNLAAAAFASDVGVDNDALQLPDGAVIYYAVTGVTPSRERTLDEVKGKVEQQWRDDEIAKRLKAKTDEMVGKLKSGSTLGQLATDAALQVQKETGMQRGKPAGFLPEKLIQAVFSTPKDVPASSDGKQATERYVFRVTGVTEPKLDLSSAEGKAIATSLENSYADDITGEYIAQLERNFGVDINQSLVDQVIGGAR